MATKIQYVSRMQFPCVSTDEKHMTHTQRFFSKTCFSILKLNQGAFGSYNLKCHMPLKLLKQSRLRRSNPSVRWAHSSTCTSSLLGVLAALFGFVLLLLHVFLTAFSFFSFITLLFADAGRFKPVCFLEPWRWSPNLPM